MHAYIVVSLMARVRPEEAGAIGRVEDVDLDGDLPRLWYCARIGPGETRRRRGGGPALRYVNGDQAKQRRGTSQA